MTTETSEALRALLAQLRPILDELIEYHPGVCVLHLDATIAALESHLLRSDTAADEEQRPSLALSQTLH